MDNLGIMLPSTSLEIESGTSSKAVDESGVMRTYTYDCGDLEGGQVRFIIKEDEATPFSLDEEDVHLLGERSSFNIYIVEVYFLEIKTNTLVHPDNEFSGKVVRPLEVMHLVTTLRDTTVDEAVESLAEIIDDHESINDLRNKYMFKSNIMEYKSGDVVIFGDVLDQ